MSNNTAFISISLKIRCPTLSFQSQMISIFCLMKKNFESSLCDANGLLLFISVNCIHRDFLPLQCDPFPVHSSFMLLSHPLCPVQKGNWRISGGFQTPNKPKTDRKTSGLEIILSYGPRLARLVMSQADKHLRGLPVFVVCQSKKVFKVRATPNLLRRQAERKTKVQVTMFCLQRFLLLLPSISLRFHFPLFYRNHTSKSSHSASFFLHLQYVNVSLMIPCVCRCV